MSTFIAESACGWMDYHQDCSMSRPAMLPDRRKNLVSLRIALTPNLQLACDLSPRAAND